MLHYLLFLIPMLFNNIAIPSFGGVSNVSVYKGSALSRSFLIIYLGYLLEIELLHWRVMFSFLRLLALPHYHKNLNSHQQCGSARFPTETGINHQHYFLNHCQSHKIKLAFFYVFLIFTEADYLKICLLAIYISYSVILLLKYFAHFSTGVYIFSLSFVKTCIIFVIIFIFYNLNESL